MENNKINRNNNNNTNTQIYSLDQFRDFVKNHFITPPLDADEQDLHDWLDEHPVLISVNNGILEIPYDADAINELEYSFSQINEAINGSGIPTIGNMKINSRSQYYIKEFIDKYWDEKTYHGIEQKQFVKYLLSRLKDLCAFSDFCEQIRYEEDLRPSEIDCLYKDFEDNKIYKILVDIISQKIKETSFELDYSENGDKTFLVFYNDNKSIDVITYLWGGGYSIGDFNFSVNEKINKFLNEIEEEIRKEI